MTNRKLKSESHDIIIYNIAFITWETATGQLDQHYVGLKINSTTIRGGCEGVAGDS